MKKGVIVVFSLIVIIASIYFFTKKSDAKKEENTSDGSQGILEVSEINAKTVIGESYNIDDIVVQNKLDIAKKNIHKNNWKQIGNQLDYVDILRDTGNPVLKSVVLKLLSTQGGNSKNLKYGYTDDYINKISSYIGVVDLIAQYNDDKEGDMFQAMFNFSNTEGDLEQYQAFRIYPNDWYDVVNSKDAEQGSRGSKTKILNLANSYRSIALNMLKNAKMYKEQIDKAAIDQILKTTKINGYNA